MAQLATIKKPVTKSATRTGSGRMPSVPARPKTAAVKVAPPLAQASDSQKTGIASWLWLSATAAAVLVTVVVYVSIFIPRNTGFIQPAAMPQRRIAAAGLVEAESGLLKLSFEIPGKLRRVLIEEGQSVQSGQIIAELENDDLSARVDSARASLRLAEAHLKTIEGDLAADVIRAERNVDRFNAELALMKAGPRQEEIARARADVMGAQADLRRTEEDAAKYADPTGIQRGAWTVQQRDEKKHLAEMAAARLASAKESLGALEAGYRKEDIDKAQALLAGAQSDLKRARETAPSRLETARAELAEAQARVKLAESELKKSVLRAPFSGSVVWKYKHTGESVGVLPPDPVIAIADCTKLRVRASVDEADYSQIRTGQSVKLTCDSCAGKTFSGRVSRVSHSAGPKKFSTGEARERVDVNVVETLITLEDSSALKLGVRMTAFFEACDSTK